MHEGASEPTLGGEFCSDEGGPENGCTGYNGEVKYGDGSPTLYKGVFDITTVRKEIAYAVKFDPMFYSNLQTRSGSSLLL